MTKAELLVALAAVPGHARIEFPDGLPLVAVYHEVTPEGPLVVFPDMAQDRHSTLRHALRVCDEDEDLAELDDLEDKLAGGEVFTVADETRLRELRGEDDSDLDPCEAENHDGEHCVRPEGHEGPHRSGVCWPNEGVAMTPNTNLYLPWSLDEARADKGPNNLDYVVSDAEGNTACVVLAHHGDDPEALAQVEAIIACVNLGLTTCDPETSIESQTFIDTGRKPFAAFVVTRETQSDLGHIDTDVLDVFTTEEAARAEVERLEAEDLADGLRVAGREEEWNSEVSSPEWETSYSFSRSTLRKD